MLKWLGYLDIQRTAIEMKQVKGRLEGEKVLARKSS